MNLKDFCDILNEIDRNFNQEGTPLKQRKSLAANLIAKKFNWKLNLGQLLFIKPEDNITIEKFVNENNAVKHIVNYFEYKYYNYTPPEKFLGSCLITIQNMPFEISFPIIFGTVPLHINNNLNDRYNILNLIKNFPPNLAKYLTNDDAENLKADFEQNLELFNKLGSFSNKNIFAKAALEDHRIAINEICLEKPDEYGQAKWSVLQFIEKVMKAILQIKDSSINFKKLGHKLNDIDDKIRNLFDINTKKDLITYIDCNANVRYGEEVVSRSDTIQAYKSAMKYLHDLMNNHFIKELI
ncbi:hypothetical protein IBE10_08630 [Francisella tularensis subsp. novicida]|uniref:hypothetical protein n=1 Tax=Francisella tularensis TaxID=263 RepID=UPI0008FD0AC3|nr:hypothetical protein [Francisella tularensis]APC95663.1 hypothetical protein KX02_1172 [Francisella tularensis subsp. novicida]MBK2346980.1 hypothetical protein [Francisella tularensis subsp. novicida]